jgi:BlaI family penicillinase repressor
MATTRLGRVQFRIMQVLWSRRAASAREITDALNPGMNIAHSTVQTLLRKLEDKGVVTHEVQDRTFVFRPTVDPKSITRSATKDFLERVFSGSAAGAIAHLLTEERISSTEMQDLRKLIDRQDVTRGKKS